MGQNGLGNARFHGGYQKNYQDYRVSSIESANISSHQFKGVAQI